MVMPPAACGDRARASGVAARESVRATVMLIPRNNVEQKNRVFIFGSDTPVSWVDVLI
jgi:hypothetical protein